MDDVIKILIPHPGNVNDPWFWLREIAKLRMQLRGEHWSVTAAFLDQAYKAYLGAGLAACFRYCEENGFEIVKDPVV